MIYAGFEFIKQTMSNTKMKYLANTVGVKLGRKKNTLKRTNVLIRRGAHTRLTYLMVSRYYVCDVVRKITVFF